MGWIVGYWNWATSRRSWWTKGLAFGLPILVAYVIIYSIASGGGDNQGTAQPPPEPSAAGAVTPSSPSPGAATTQSPAPSPTVAAQTYTVVAGDTPLAIAQKLGIPQAEQNAWSQQLLSLNNVTAGGLQVGQVLRLMASGGASPASSPSPPSGVQARVVRVVDGDTIEVDRALDGRATVRYIGIDTPETVAPGEPVGCYGPQASAKNKELVDGKTVYLEKDVSETDRFGRLLRYVYLENGQMVNELLVRDGFAQVSTFPPDVKYQQRFLDAQRQARDSNRGLWGACPAGQAATSTPRPAGAQPAPTNTTVPSGASACPQRCATPPQGCVIKGNISQTTGRKYSMFPEEAVTA